MSRNTANLIGMFVDAVTSREGCVSRNCVCLYQIFRRHRSHPARDV